MDIDFFLLGETSGFFGQVVEKPPAAAAVSEDQAAEGGESIATFASYQPTALPKSLIEVLNSSDSNNKNNKNKDEELLVAVLP